MARMTMSPAAVTTMSAISMVRMVVVPSALV
jgi:hypothetical protein